MAERHSTIMSQLYLPTCRKCPENISLGFNRMSPHISFQNGSSQNIWINRISPHTTYMPYQSQQPTLNYPKNK